jgi:penicillin-binding protein 1C
MLADPHARATAFGVESVLSLPFPAAVKTGTSSDYRDTWTVGFTSDYTVATWVGNFDGSPMRQVSGVTGAAPLWHRIMVHLHENREPLPFAPPAGLVKRPICAVTGQKPTADCEAIVQEYFAPADLIAYENSTATTVTVVDPPPETALRIVSPSSGSRFLLYSSVSHQEQQLEFAIAGQPSAPFEWRLNGQPLDNAGQTSLFWPLQAGQWTLEVQSGEQRDRVQFEVEEAESRSPRQGFSVVDE